MDSYFSY